MSPPKTSAGQKRAVLEGRMLNTPGKLEKKDLKVNSTGRVVSKKASTSAKTNYNEQGVYGPKGWIAACKQAAAILNYWPVPVTKGSEFHKLAKKIHMEMKQ